MRPTTVDSLRAISGLMPERPFKIAEKVFGSLDFLRRELFVFLTRLFNIFLEYILFNTKIQDLPYLLNRIVCSRIWKQVILICLKRSERGIF